LNQKPKVLHTLTWLAPGGGVDISVAKTIDLLSDKYEFHLVHGRVVNENVLTKMKGLKRIVCRSMYREIKPLSDLRALWWLYRHIKKEGYDIVHTHEAKASVLTRLAAKWAGVPIIIFGLEGVTYNDPMSNWRRNFYIWVERLTIGTNDMIVAVGQETIDAYHNEGIGNHIPYKVIYAGVEMDPFVKDVLSEDEREAKRQELGYKADDVVWINVGRFSSSKAQRYSIEALAKVSLEVPEVKLLLIGEGECMDDCKALAAELGVADKVQFYGYSTEVPALLQAADLFVMTSLREGLPRVVVEASMAKLPTCTFQVEGVREVITDAKNGYIVASPDVDALAQKLTQLSRNGALRLQFGQAAYDFCHERWDADKTIGELDEIYKSCLSKLK